MIDITIPLSETRFGKDLIEYGREDGVTGMCLRLSKKKFGPLPDVVVTAIEDLPYHQLEELTEELLDLASLADLESWLAARK